VDGSIAVVFNSGSNPPLSRLLLRAVAGPMAARWVIINGSNFVTGITVQFGANTPVVANVTNATLVTVLNAGQCAGGRECDAEESGRANGGP